MHAIFLNSQEIDLCDEKISPDDADALLILD